MYNAAAKLYIIGPRIDYSRVNAGQRRAGMITALTSEFNAAFDWAVIRLATYVPAGTTQPRLLFGTVSLLTKDRPRPFSRKGVERHPVGKGKWGKVFFRRTALSAHDAVVWYRARPDRTALTLRYRELTDVGTIDAGDIARSAYWTA